MSTRPGVYPVSAVVLFAALAIGGTAAAELSSKPVTAAFKGQLIVSKSELPVGKTDKDTISKIKAVQLKEVIGQPNEEVTYWTFHYTAFLSRTGSTALRMEFYADGKRFVADKHLDGIDPKVPVLSGDIAINEDEGLAKGKSYTIKLLNPKNAVVAQAKLTMK